MHAVAVEAARTRAAERARRRRAIGLWSDPQVPPVRARATDHHLEREARLFAAIQNSVLPHSSAAVHLLTVRPAIVRNVSDLQRGRMRVLCLRLLPRHLISGLGAWAGELGKGVQAAAWKSNLSRFITLLSPPLFVN